MSDDSTMRPRRGFVPPPDADEVDADTRGPAAADDHSAGVPEWRPRRGSLDEVPTEDGSAAGPASEPAALAGRHGGARHLDIGEENPAPESGPNLGSRLLARLRRAAASDDDEPAPEAPGATDDGSSPAAEHLEPGTTSQSSAGSRVAVAAATEAVIEAPALVEAPHPAEDAEGGTTEAAGSPDGGVAPDDGAAGAQATEAVEYDLPIYRDEPASATPGRSPSTVGGDDVHQHALFLPPEVEGSLSHTWILRALREAEAREPGEAPLEETAPNAAVDRAGHDVPPVAPADHAPSAPPPAEEPVGLPAGPAAPSLARRLLPWVAGGVLTAIIVGAIVLGTTRKPATVVTSAASAAATGSTAMVTTSDLLTARSASAIEGDARWSVASTLTSLDASSPSAACLNASGRSGEPRATSTALRTLTTDSRAGLAALHQIDGFQSANDARSAFQSRRTSLGTCDAVPMYIVGSDAMSGLGDEAVSVTVASQEKTTTYHTLLVVRTGRVLDTFDVARTGSAVAASGLAKAAAGVVSEQCGKAGGGCAASPRTSASAPPVGRLAGWLEVSDLPRLTPGAGEWTTTEAGAVSSTTTQCEGMTLATVNGPRTRQQRTYLLTQDSLAPASFGLDELKFGFASAKDAAAFARTLGDNIARCDRTMASASVSQAASFSVPGSRTGVGTVSGRSFLITQKTGGSTSVSYRVAVVQLGTQVIYLMNNPTKGFGFDAGAIRDAAVRAAQRAAEVA